MAPTQTPSTCKGIPPRTGIWRPRVARESPRESTTLTSSPVRAGAEGRRRIAAQCALPMAISTEESFAPSMRAKASRWPPSSTTAISIGTLISAARACAAARTSCAPSRVNLGLLRVTAGMGHFSLRLFLPYVGIQDIGGLAALEKGDRVFDRHHGHSRARFERGRRQVRRQDHIRAKQAVADLRFALVDIQGRAGDLAPLEGRDERGFLYHGPARSVDQESSRFHQGQFTRADQAPRGREERYMQAQEIGLPENGVAFLILNC